MHDEVVVASRVGAQVVLRIDCADDYAAIELFDTLTRAARRGAVTLRIEGATVAQRPATAR